MNEHTVSTAGLSRRDLLVGSLVAAGAAGLPSVRGRRRTQSLHPLLQAKEQ